MDQPLISVIIPVYNMENYLDRCIDSIVNQTYHNLEIILVDDGSLDNSPQKCDDYAKKDSRIKVIHKENAGVSNARNAGIDLSCGDFIGFVDSDDSIELDMFETMINACKRDNTCLAVCGRHVILNDEKKVGKCPVNCEIIDSVDLVSRIFTGNNCDGSACDKLYHRSLWTDVRFTHGRIYEDIATIYKVALKTDRVSMISKPLYNYFLRFGSITNTNFDAKLFDYPFNTRNILVDIKNNYPSIYEHASWTHMKAIHNVLYKLFVSDNKTCRKYFLEARDLSNEIKRYKEIWSVSSLFNKRDKRMCRLFSHYYIAKAVCRINKWIKLLQKKIKKWIGVFY